MKTKSLTLACLVLAMAGTMFAASQTAGAKPEESKKFVGTWRLVSRTDRLTDGKTFLEPSLGGDPLGYLMYDTTGHVAVQLMRRNRASAEGQIDNASSPTAGSAPASLNGYEAYFGTYTVVESAHTVTHHVEGALIPANIGKDLVRNYSFQRGPSGQDVRLALSLPVVEADGTKATRTLIWERVK